ncbi:hypothetical protein G5714_012301 [Onychostoma macrolepis]|uniref:Uncharacterized protein n=1 Tax=Onychostoma macrolepis TaxID=369639 RepID=A0A7J6CGP6_9TELE|nr:hypothetical protein G5714_012301 [Onychostoma macrolepis]
MGSHDVLGGHMTNQEVISVCWLQVRLFCVDARHCCVSWAPFSCRVILEALVYSSRRTQASAWRVNIYAITSSVTRAAGLHCNGTFTFFFVLSMCCGTVEHIEKLSLYKAGSTLMLCPFSSGNHTGRDPVLGPPEQGFCIG